jgi:signal peptidase complex subunit 1
MDYKGQALSEQLFYYILISISSVGWVWGYFAQSFLVTFYVWAGALTFCVILCVPDWPIYNRNPVKWLAADTFSQLEGVPEKETASTPAPSSGTKQKSKKSKKE